MKYFTPRKIEITKNLVYKEGGNDLYAGIKLWTVPCPRGHRDQLNDYVHIEWRGKTIRLEKGEYNIIL